MRRKLLFTAVIVVILLIALFDALDLFTNKPYRIIPHGSHNHYVPYDKIDSLSVHDFPMEAPAADEMITPDGRIVKKP